MGDVVQGDEGSLTALEGGQLLDLCDKVSIALDGRHGDPLKSRYGWIQARDFARVIPKLVATMRALETENAQHVNAIECLRQERDELVLALGWCKSRMKRPEYEQHVEWTLSKYSIPGILAVLKNPDDDYCQSDPRGPGRPGR